MRDQRLLEEVDVATNQKGLEAARRNISNIFFEFFCLLHLFAGFLKHEIFTRSSVCPPKLPKGMIF